ncbi:hypothetical protein B0H16DRAFT_1469560 [Mycena metata]|uniref:Uncharacterized protein n=1 Tax=Mycena metata TaxID=1033252 RepID=A0AAD7HXT3_9AGAR|nr:hypothetical protein B0H16DRAFT_1469560 [Mycena metata]
MTTPSTPRPQEVEILFHARREGPFLYPNLDELRHRHRGSESQEYIIGSTHSHFFCEGNKRSHGLYPGLQEFQVKRNPYRVRKLPMSEGDSAFVQQALSKV